jgi:hypothetical protein
VVSPKPVKIIFLKYGLLSNPCFFGNRDFFVTSDSFTNYPPNQPHNENQPQKGSVFCSLGATSHHLSFLLRVYKSLSTAKMQLNYLVLAADKFYFLTVVTKLG